jgi:hypothetical protein
VVDTCVHYWVFEPPLGRISKGVCKHCGKETEAVNYVEMNLVSGHPMKKNLSKEEKERPHPEEDEGEPYI